MAKFYLTNATIPFFKNFSHEVDTIEIENGRITRVGSKVDMLPGSRSSKNIIDLQQSVVFPGFTDSHIHLLKYGLSLHTIDLSGATKSECLQRVAQKASETPVGKWIIGHGWDQNNWQDGFGTKDDLDAISLQHPIYLTHKSLHCAWLNSLALRLSGIDDKREDPPGGTILRDEKDNPVGILLERAMELVDGIIPEQNSGDVELALRSAQQSLNALGITAVHDFDPWTVYTTLGEMAQNNTISLRVTKGIPENHLDQVISAKYKSGFGNDWVRIGWLKLFADGALGPQTAAMIGPYLSSDNYGMLLLNLENIYKYGEKSLSAGIAMAVHAIGDQANQVVLQAYEKLSQKSMLSIPALPSRIEHVQLLAQDDFQRLGELGVVASMQPIHAVSDKEMAQAYWGDRCQRAYAWRSILENNTHLIFGSDAPVESPNPFHGIAAAISRRSIFSPTKGKSNQGWVTNQCINLNAAILAYTQNPGQVSGFRELEKPFHPGGFADLVILPPNFLELSPEQIHFSKPVATMVDGKWVYINDNIDIEFF